MKQIYLAGGCFWGTQHFFSLINGVTFTQAGYANGIKDNPTYKEVCSTKYEFVEAVKIDYDETIVTLNKLLEKFFLTIDPTSLNKQGGDKGIQYRTGIYYIDEQSKEIALKMLSKLQKEYSKDIKIELKPLLNFYKAEDEHQEYLVKHPFGYCHIPKSLFKKANI